MLVMNTLIKCYIVKCSFRFLEKGCSRGRPANGRAAVFPFVNAFPFLLTTDCPVFTAVKVELYM